MKKATIGLEQIVFAILTLIVLSTGTVVITDLASKPVRYLLGISDISSFDQDIVDRYEQTKGMNADAISSTNALLYSINALALHDDCRYNPHSKFCGFGGGSFGGSGSGTGFSVAESQYTLNRKEFGYVSAVPIDLSGKLEKLTGNKDEAVLQLARLIVDCDMIFSDVGEDNTECFKLDLDGLDEGVSIKKEDIVQGLKKYRSHAFCNQQCMDRIDDILGRGILNIMNLNVKVELAKGINAKVCGDNSRLNEIHITKTDDTYDCKPTRGYQQMGFYIDNFALPQEISKSNNAIVHTVEDWLNAYGDPQYIIFYEKFPKAEEEYWKADNYNIALLSIVGTQAVFLGIDAITWGMGKALKPLVPVLKGAIGKLGKTAVGRAFHALRDAIKGVTEPVLKATGKMLKKVFDKTIKRTMNFIIGKQLTKEAIEELAEKEMGKILKKMGKELAEDEMLLLKKKFLKAFNELGDDIFSPDGKLTKEAIDGLKDNFLRNMGDTVGDTVEDKALLNTIKSKLGPDYDNIVREIGSELSDSASKIGYRSLTRQLIKVYGFASKSANRARNMLKMALAGDMTDEAREKALLKLIEAGQDGLSKMKPYELRSFLANSDKTVDMLFDKYTGKVLWGEVIDAGEDAVSQAAAKEALAQRLDDVIMRYGEENIANFPMSVAIQKHFASIPSEAIASITKNPKAMARFLVTASVAYYAIKLESMGAKYYPMGTNAIGLKTPYMDTVVFDNVSYLPDTLEERDEFVNEFLENYGEGPIYNGMLPVANKYFLSLVRDQGQIWGNQDSERFFLVSPCYADILLKVTNCECEGYENPDGGLYQTGKTYELSDGRIINVPHFDGKNPMFYSLDENGNPIKECYSSSLWRAEKHSSVLCIEINPILEEDREYNYCYHGKNPGHNTLKTAITGVEMGLTMLGVFCGPAAPACMAGIGFVAGIGSETLKAGLDIGHQWPNHD